MPDTIQVVTLWNHCILHLEGLLKRWSKIDQVDWNKPGWVGMDQVQWTLFGQSVFLQAAVMLVGEGIFDEPFFQEIFHSAFECPGLALEVDEGRQFIGRDGSRSKCIQYHLRLGP